MHRFVFLGIVSCCVLNSFLMQAQVSDILKDKWKKNFNGWDINNDGEVTMEDVKLFINTFIKLHNIPLEDSRQSAKGLYKFWYCFHPDLLQGKPYVTEQEFLDRLTVSYEENKAKFVEHYKKCEQLVFDAIDVNGDGYMSAEEFVKAYRAWGFNDTSSIMDIYRAHKRAENGLIPDTAFIANWVDFLTNDHSDQNVEQPTRKF